MINTIKKHTTVDTNNSYKRGCIPKTRYNKYYSILP